MVNYLKARKIQVTMSNIHAIRGYAHGKIKSAALCPFLLPPPPPLIEDFSLSDQQRRTICTVTHSGLTLIGFSLY